MLPTLLIAAAIVILIILATGLMIVKVIREEHKRDRERDKRILSGEGATVRTVKPYDKFNAAMTAASVESLSL